MTPTSKNKALSAWVSTAGQSKLRFMLPEEFVKTVVTSYENNRGVFSNKVNAEDLIPEGLSDQNRALFLFYVIQLDYATKSQNLYRGANELYRLNPSFFTTVYQKETSQESVTDLLKKYLRPRYLNEAIRRYQINTDRLLKNYSGKPLKIFKESKTALEALEKVRTFRGFGPKIGNFFVRTMVNTFSFDYPDIQEILPPVDVHDVRIAYLMGYVPSKEMTTRNIQTVKELWSKACKKAKVSWLTFDKALWLLGSEGRPQSKNDVLKLIS